VLALGEVDDEKYATAAGPSISASPSSRYRYPEILPSGICTYEHVVATFRTATCRPGGRVPGEDPNVEIPIPVRHVRRSKEASPQEDVAVEFGGRYTHVSSTWRAVMDRLQDG